MHPSDDNHLSKLKKQDSQADSLPDNIRKNSKSDNKSLGTEQDLLSMGRGRRRAAPLADIDNFNETKAEESGFKFKLDSPGLKSAKDSLQNLFPIIAEEKEDASNSGNSLGVLPNLRNGSDLPFAVTLQVPSIYENNKHKLSDETGATSLAKTAEVGTFRTNITSVIELDEV